MKAYIKEVDGSAGLGFRGKDRHWNGHWELSANGITLRKLTVRTGANDNL